jgi:putative phage-type endonuclease
MSRRFQVINCEQRTPEWFEARAGRLTGSVAADVLAKGRGSDEAVGRRDLRLRLAIERLTGQPQEDAFANDATRWGVEHEAEAIAAYEARTGEIAMSVGFVAHNDMLAGCSPDGVIGDFAGLVSIKCPYKTAIHIGYLRDGRIPPAYLPQTLMELWITGAAWCDFVSYDPRLPAGLQTFLYRYERDEAAIAEFARKAEAFLAEVDNEVMALRTLAHLPAVLADAKEVA